MDCKDKAHVVMLLATAAPWPRVRPGHALDAPGQASDKPRQAQDSPAQHGSKIPFTFLPKFRAASLLGLGVSLGTILGAPSIEPFFLRGGGSSQRAVSTPCVTFRLVVVSLRALDSHLFVPSHVASGRCVLSAAAAGAPARVVSVFTEPSGWRAGAVLDVPGCAICVPAAPSSWHIEDVLVIAGVV